MSNQLLENPKARLSALLEQSQKHLQIEKLSIDGYEQVLKITDRSVGLNAIISIHSTVLGPALGGTRIQSYATFDAALEDALRLSKGMTYKSAVAEVGFGGGKSVIIADPKTQKTPALLAAFGAAVDRLNGQYICAEDMGSTTADVSLIRRATPYVVGLPHEKSSGDPSPFTAWGVFRGIQSIVKRLYNTDSLEGRKIAVQGLGNVGSRVAEHLFWAGADLILTDVDTHKLEQLCAKYRAQAVHPDQILSQECDILVPCARGAMINDTTLPKFRCKAIAGAANNQLHEEHHADVLRSKGILYAPDFVINAGGLLNVAEEVEEAGYNPKTPRYKIHHIYDTLLAIYEIADKNRESTHAAALSLANYRLKYGIGKRVISPTFHHTVEE